MATTVKTGWLHDKNGDKFAPKTLTSQVQTNDGVLLEDKIQSDLSTKINVSDIADNLTTNSTSKVLSAAQGVVIKDVADGLQSQINELDENKINVSDIADNLTTNSSSKVLSASQGLTLYNLIQGVQSDVSTLNSEFDGHDHTAAQITDVEWMATTSLADGTEILPEQTISFTSKFAFATGDSYKLVEGGRYTVYWNGTAYTCTAVLASSGDMVLGNGYYHSTTMQNTGEPFCFTEANGSGMVKKSTSTAESITARIVEIVQAPNKLPEEFLPYSVQTQIDEVKNAANGSIASVSFSDNTLHFQNNSGLTTTVPLPYITTYTDNKVAQTVTSTNAEYPLLTTVTANATSSSTTSANFASGVTLNPYSKTITATTFKGNATTATTATKLGSSTIGSASQPIYLSSGTATKVTAVGTAYGGTGATTIAGARTNLDVYSKSEVDTALSQKSQVQFITWEADD